MNLDTAIGELLGYCRAQNWVGYDPFDGLNSRLFQATPLRRSAFARLALIQGVKRSPINFRPLLRIAGQENPKGLAIFASAAVKLSRLGLAEQTMAQTMIDRLLRLRSPGFETLCWGYPFDWQNRHFMLPRHHPNIICSTFGGQALLDVFEHDHDTACLEAANSVTQFVLTKLNRTADGDRFCFSYTPLDSGQVHNANLLGAAFLARVWQHTHAEALEREALRAARFSVDRQRPDGSWVYGEAATQQWIDGFHTGYNLVALKRLHAAYGLPWLKASLDRGVRYYRDHFFAGGGIAKYYDDRIYPLDIHSTAQGIITLVELAGTVPDAIPLAETLLDWANSKMRSSAGYYYYQKHRYWTIRIPYMRWAQAWMLLAMAYLAEAKAKADRDPSAVCSGPSGS